MKASVQKPILIMTVASGIRDESWLDTPWVIPEACVLWWQCETGWQSGPAHVFNSELPVADDSKPAEPAKPKRRK